MTYVRDRREGRVIGYIEDGNAYIGIGISSKSGAVPHGNISDGHMHLYYSLSEPNLMGNDLMIDVGRVNGKYIEERIGSVDEESYKRVGLVSGCDVYRTRWGMKFKVGRSSKAGGRDGALLLLLGMEPTQFYIDCVNDTYEKMGVDKRVVNITRRRKPINLIITCFLALHVISVLLLCIYLLVGAADIGGETVDGFIGEESMVTDWLIISDGGNEMIRITSSDLVINSRYDDVFATNNVGIAIDKIFHDRQFQKVWIDQVGISDLGFQEGQKSLNELYMYNCKLIDLNGLELVQGLEKLTIVSSTLDDVDVISKLNELEVLDLRANDIIAIAFVSNLTELRDLNLSNNRIKELSALGELINLESI